MKDSTYFYALSTVGAMLCISSEALAQNTNESEALSFDSPIVVTAQRRDEDPQTIPIAIDFATGDQLKAVGATGVQDIGLIAPGAEVQANNFYAVPIIRGVGTKAFGAGFENPIALYVDGVYYASPTASVLSFNNIERVEVLRGPQGTLFGRNATGGLIQIVTRDPEHDFGGHASISYGNYETLSGDLYLSGGLADSVAIDFAFNAITMGDGYGTNLLSGKDVYRTHHDISARSRLLAEIGDRTEVRLTFDYYSIESSQNAVRAIGTAPAPFGPDFGGDEWDISSVTEPLVTSESGGVALRIDHDLGDVNLVSLTAYRSLDYHVLFDVDYTPTEGRVAEVHQNDWQFSQEFQLLSDSNDSFNWVLGGYYFSAEGEYDPVDVHFLGPAALPAGPFGTFVLARTTSQQSTESFSAFGQGTLEVSPDLDVTVGLRYTFEERSFKGMAVLTATSGAEIPAVPYSERELNFEKLTWRFAVDYQVSGDILAYASVNRGFKSGGFNPSALSLPPFAPEVLDAYEVGIKTTPFGRESRLNLAGFYYDYDNLQLTRSVNGTAGIDNGGSAEIYGFEAQLFAEVAAGLSVTAGYQYLHGRYTSFPDSVASFPDLGPGELVGFADVTGNDTVLSPHSTFSIASQYERSIGPHELSFTANLYYNSGYFHESDNRLREPAYALLNLSATVEFEGGYSASIWGRNLTNQSVATAAGIVSFGTTGLFRASYAPPRTYGVTLGLEF